MCSFIGFGYFLVNFGNFQRFWKNQEIQDGGSKLAAVLEPDLIVTSYDVISLCCGPQRKHFGMYYLPSKFCCHSLNILGVKRWGRISLPPPPPVPSSETQGQLVGMTGFSWAKVYNKSGRAPGHLHLPNEFQKHLKSRLLIGQKNIFLANQRRGTAGRLLRLLTRGCFPHRTPK